MASIAQRRATSSYRRRSERRGLVRVEVKAPRTDVGLIRELASALSGDPMKAAQLRARIRDALGHARGATILDLLASDLPDSAFEGVFDQLRDEYPREFDL